jgi:hypothetical protein
MIRGHQRPFSGMNRSLFGLGPIQSVPQTICRLLVIQLHHADDAAWFREVSSPRWFGLDQRAAILQLRFSMSLKPRQSELVSPAIPEHLHHFIAQMVDHLYGDPPGFRLVEGARGVAVQRGPGFLVDLGLERGLERLVRIVRAQEIGVRTKKLSSL